MKTGQDFDLHRGRDRSLIYILNGPAGEIIEHVGTTARWQLRPGHGHLPLVDKTNGDGLTVDQDPTELTLRVRVELDPSDTQDLEHGSYIHEMGITFLDGTEYVVAQGTMNLLATSLPPEAA